MKVTKDHVVSVHYTLTDKENNVLDSSLNQQPLTYLHGHQMMIPGFEKGLEGSDVGAKLSFDVTCDDAYGVKNEQMIFSVPKAQFPEEERNQIKLGSKVHGQSETGHIQPFEVIEITEDEFVLDGNHPLAGKDLHFDVEVIEVRPATPEEIDHGHVH